MAVRSGWKYMGEAIASVLGQTFQTWELLIGLNGLEETTEARSLAIEASDCDRRVCALEFFHATNKPEVLNRLCRMATGRYVAVLDVDDLWMPEKLAIQVPLLEMWDVVGSEAEYFGEGQSPIRVKTGEVLLEDLLETNHIVNSSVVLKREWGCWPSTDGLDDYPLWLRLSSEGRRFYVVPQVLTRIRLHNDRWFADKRDDSRQIRERFLATL